MVLLKEASNHLFDLSFMYSKHCDLECLFCMYDSSPQVHDKLDLTELKQFIRTIDFNLINSCGFYGGEPSLFMKENTKIMDMLPLRFNIPKFVITNGTWSKSLEATQDFLQWMLDHKLTVYISQTTWHKQFQDAESLAFLSKMSKHFILKESDTQMLSMGRLARQNPSCFERCQWDQRPTRIAVQPDGSIIFQTCDGVYPVIGHMRDGFDFIHERVLQEKRMSFMKTCKDITRKTRGHLYDNMG